MNQWGVLLVLWAQCTALPTCTHSCCLVVTYTTPHSSPPSPKYVCVCEGVCGRHRCSAICCLEERLPAEVLSVDCNNTACMCIPVPTLTQGKQMPPILNAAGVKASCLGVCVLIACTMMCKHLRFVYKSHPHACTDNAHTMHPHPPMYTHPLVETTSTRKKTTPT